LIGVAGASRVSRDILPYDGTRGEGEVASSAHRRGKSQTVEDFLLG
jgi:hypothetical protein